MKKILIGGLIGGLLLFAWQTISWTVANLHQDGQQYSSKQDSVLSYLASSGLAYGSYLMPTLPPETPMAEMEKQMENIKGKPWARLSYYESWNANMGMNMARGYVSNVIIVMLLCWLLAKIGQAGFSTYLLACLAIGIICFTNGPYTGHIWYPLHDITAFFVDAIVSWGLVGIWLGWWMRRK
jgi:hypothetical protein